MNDKYRKLDSGENFLFSAKNLSVDNEVALVYLSSFGKRILETCNSWSMDGTFKTVPREFSQLYVVFGEVKSNKLLPCAYLLLPGKSASIYNHALEVLCQEISNAPSEINIDFEQAMVRAIRTNIPHCTVLGCNFHWKKAIFANVGFKGCLHLFHENENFQIGLDLIYTLCLVPPADVEYAWETVVQPYFDDNFTDDQGVIDFLCYVENTYIGKPIRQQDARRQPMYSVEMWNIFNRILEDKATTNNPVESWNSRWNRSMGTNHNIWRVIQGFKTEDSLARQKLAEMVTGQNTEPNPSRADRRSARLQQLRTALGQYDRNTIKEFMFGLRDDA